VLHNAKVYWGDLNEENVVVTGEGLVTLIDLDTAAFRVRNTFYPGSGYVRDDWRPPEYTSSTSPFTAEGDRWALAVEIYVLLMESYRPFACSDYVDLTPADYVKRGLSPLLDNSLRLPKGSPPLDVLPPSLSWLLCKCFGEGRERPTLRPPPARYVERFSPRRPPD
jgi:DNA-binding helix-hairpin-helix protein with protein kinase domain